MPGEAWVGLNDINVENHFVYTDGTPAVSHTTTTTYNPFQRSKYVSICGPSAKVILKSPAPLHVYVFVYVSVSV